MIITVNPDPVNYDEIKKCTNDFSEQCKITDCQFGKVYRGRDKERNFTVKLFDIDPDLSRSLFVVELYGLDQERREGYPKPIFFCEEENLPRAIVYDLDLMDTVHNLIPKDTFSWSQRMKVAIGTASAIKSFYPCLIRNIHAAHILCDQNYTPKLCDFGLIGGVFSSHIWKCDELKGSRGYTDPYYVSKGECSEKTDVFAFGLILLGLITKKVVSAEKDTDTDLIEWAQAEYESQKQNQIKLPSLVDPSLRLQMHYDPLDGHGTTRLALKCMALNPDERPTMEEVVKRLKGLKVVRCRLSLQEDPMTSM